jgi:hypothetical protein
MPKKLIVMLSLLCACFIAWGVEPDEVQFLRLAADQGNASVQYNLGARYDKGKGVPEDNKEAVK